MTRKQLRLHYRKHGRFIGERDAVIDRLRRDVDLLKSRLYSQLRYLHGPKSERFDNGQLPLFGSPLEIASPAPPKPKRPLTSFAYVLVVEPTFRGCPESR